MLPFRKTYEVVGWTCGDGAAYCTDHLPAEQCPVHNQDSEAHPVFLDEADGLYCDVCFIDLITGKDYSEYREGGE